MSTANFCSYLRWSAVCPYCEALQADDFIAQHYRETALVYLHACTLQLLRHKYEG